MSRTTREKRDLKSVEDYKSVERSSKELKGQGLPKCKVHSPKFAQVGPLPKRETVETNLHSLSRNQHGDPNQTAFPTTWGRHSRNHES
jgi:hypothetical protein